MITEHKEAIKIYDGITYIDEDLIEELQSVLEEGATDSMKKGMGNFNKIVIPAIVVVCIIFAFVSVVMIGAFRGEGVYWRRLLNVEMGGVLDVIIGKRDENGKIMLDAEVIKGADYSLLETVETYLKKEVNYEEIVQGIEIVAGDVTSDFLIANAGKICISKNSMPVIFLNSNAVLRIYYFLFVDGMVVGDLLFFEHNGKVSYSIDLYTEDLGGIYTDYLMANQGKEFIAIGDEMGAIYFLSEENAVIKPTTGSEAKDITVSGDCYNAFSDKVKVSFEKIGEETIETRY